MEREPEAIIFDFGGVLIDISYAATEEAFRQLGAGDFDNLYSQARQTSLFDLFETGQISAQRFINDLLNFLPPGTSPNAVVSAWNAMIGEVPAESIRLLEDLRDRGKKLFLLSNTNEIHIPIALKAWKRVSAKDIYEMFDGVYLSFEIHKRKPDPETFEYVIRDRQLNPELTLFIDDSIQHVEGAKEAGLMTFHLKDRSSLYRLFS